MGGSYNLHNFFYFAIDNGRNGILEMLMDEEKMSGSPLLLLFAADPDGEAVSDNRLDLVFSTRTDLSLIHI